MADSIPGYVAGTTSDERTMATLAHVLQLVGGWIAPLIIFLVKRDSRFVSFHALQALLLQGLYFLLIMILMAGIFAAVLAGVAFHQPADQHRSLPPAFVLIFPIFWLGMMGWWVLVLVVAIVYGIKAGRGEWAEYPLIGRLARHILKIGPPGASQV
ncbi:MAG TPA: DUF4870 domain-containing protein [Candidatus Dormibacteraeota bacterium]|nr:DUF4870 domain-containing protein [Candidatus Dormibacteraeota bacterium]